MGTMKGLDGLMSLDPHVRGEFLEKIMEGVEPAFTQTQPGDPEKMRALKATLPNISTVLKIGEFDDLYNPNPKVIVTLSRRSIQELREILLDLEMSLCGGG